MCEGGAHELCHIGYLILLPQSLTDSFDGLYRKPKLFRDLIRIHSGPECVQDEPLTRSQRGLWSSRNSFLRSVDSRSHPSP